MANIACMRRRETPRPGHRPGYSSYEDSYEWNRCMTVVSVVDTGSSVRHASALHARSLEMCALEKLHREVWSMELFSSIAHREFEPLSNKNNGLLASAVNVIISRVQMQRPTNVCRKFHEDYLISE